MSLLKLRVTAIRYEAQGILGFELRMPEGGELPPFSAGAHVDVHLGNGLIRSYSLANSPLQRDRYVIGVNLDRASRGGSAYMHTKVKAGDILTVGTPRNNFPLEEDAAHTVLLAGGIGITPLRSMVLRLQELGRSWELIYCARRPGGTAFFEELNAYEAGGFRRVRFNFDEQAGGQRLDMQEVFAGQPAGTHFYCCGPVSMLDAFEAAATDIAPECVHVEYFAARTQVGDTASPQGFNVRLAKSGRVLPIAAGQSILDAVLDAGVRVSYSCMEGICGSCETRVMEGVPDHRDLVLTKQQQGANDRMMICCSGSKSAELVLDL
jgi:vanillate O-demethylase ferredoxin subunit